MPTHSHVATKKDHRCSACGRRIPIGARYFVTGNGEHGLAHRETAREHTNCLEFENEPELPAGYNTNRKVGA